MVEASQPSDLNPTPFEWTPQTPSKHAFKIIGGIYHVYSDETMTEEPFPVPGTALDFFTDMHRCTCGSQSLKCRFQYTLVTECAKLGLHAENFTEDF